MEEQLAWFLKEVPFKVMLGVASALVESIIPKSMQEQCLDVYNWGGLVVTDKGKERVKKEWPNVWAEFELDSIPSG